MAAKDFGSAGRVVRALSPASVADGAAITGVEVDCKGWRWALVVIHCGSVAATAAGTVNVQASDTAGSGHATISGATFTVAATDDNKNLYGLIDLHQQPRYLKLAGTNGTGGASLFAASIVLYGCSNTEEYVDLASGGADARQFTVLA